MGFSAAVSALAGNHPDLTVSGQYTAILGERPSQGARSPLLWNAVFAAENLDVRMYPLDVTADGLPAMVAALKADPRFLGGAVTMPHKVLILPLLDRVDPLALKIGAVNALYRDGDALVGTNTDGAGALASLLAALPGGVLGNRQVTLLGCGGAGAAVAAFVADTLADGGMLTLWNRDIAKAEALAARLGGPVRICAASPAAAVVGADVVINCTSIGFGLQPVIGSLNVVRAATPLAAVGEDLSGMARNLAESLAALSSLSPDALVFDVIYQPLETQLLMLAAGVGRRTLNGKAMNLEQAVLGFHGAVPSVALDRIRSVMALVP
ncbi:shikimate dehydrogenase family protein [Insolitispirillum peregrinum]|uniref:shikimate dehydrogenase family protein n=1 Tax=Insolitispirillum peregrinum TaxID=80876 RepID=UPI00361E5154